VLISRALGAWWRDLVSGVIKRAKDRPGFVSPMLAKLVTKLPSGPRWEYEAKWDGYRIEALKLGKAVRLFSRRGSDFTKKFATVAEDVAGLEAGSAVIDGEVVALDHNGRPSFQALQNGRLLPAGFRLVFFAFDLLSVEGTDLRGLPLIERRELLRELVEGSKVMFSGSLIGTAAAVQRVVKKYGLEGIVAKRTDSVYEPGERTGAWVKLPLKPKEDFLIGAYRPAGNLAEILLVGKFEKGKFIFCGKVHQGLNPWNRRELVKILKPLAVKTCPFSNLPTTKKTSHWGEGVSAEEMSEYVWLRPEITAEVRFAEWTRGGVLRHAQFVSVLMDKAEA
jgi:DNA ligase D-like protein (predicted ligase)